MTDGDVCAVVLAAGEGTRLRPITELLPKPLCPVGNVPLLDRTLSRLAANGLTGTESVAVNVSYLAELIVSHVDGRAHASFEPDRPLGTAGALAHLRQWIDGRAVLVANSDAYLAPDVREDPEAGDLGGLLDGWDGQTVRVLTVPAGTWRAEFGKDRFAGVSLLPADLVAALPEGRSELVGTIWRPAERAGRLAAVRYAGNYWDTGTPQDFVAANLHAAGDGSLVAPSAVIDEPTMLHRCVIGSRAIVRGSVTRSVVLPDAEVHSGEDLVDAIRLGHNITLTSR